jgi:hypothetical protein
MKTWAAIFAILLCAGACDLFLAPMREIHEETFHPLHDGYVDDSPNVDFGGPTIRVSNPLPPPPPQDSFGALTFDVSSIPEGSRIVSADLKLKCVSVVIGGWINGRLIAKSWDPATITHASVVADPDFAPAQVFGIHVAPAEVGEIFEFNIRNIVQAWVSDLEPNYGLAFTTQEPSAEIEFSSFEGEYIPKLIVRYDYYGSTEDSQ